MPSVSGTEAADSGQSSTAHDTIREMSRLAKAVLILLLAAIPLRGMAGVVAALCDPASHGGAAIQVSDADCDSCLESAGAHHEQDDSGMSKCSHCAACSVSVPLVSQSVQGLIAAVSGESPVIFFSRTLPVRPPGRLERPPLTS